MNFLSRLHIGIAPLMVFILAWAGSLPPVLAAGQLGALDLLAESPDLAAVEPPPDLTAAQTDTFLAGVTDAEARQMLRKQLQNEALNEAVDEATPRFYRMIIEHMRDVGFRLGTESRALLDSLGDIDRETRIIVRNLTDDQGWGAVLDAIGVLLFLVATGFVVIIPLERLLKDIRNRLLNSGGRPLYQRIVRQLGDIAIGLLLVFVFALITLALSFLIFERFHPLRIFISTYLIVIATVWGVYVVLHGLLPDSKKQTPLVLSQTVIRKIRRYFFLHFGIVIIGLASSGLLEILGISPELDRVLLIVVFSFACLVLLVGVLELRFVLKQRMRRISSSSGKGNLLADYMRVWHWITLLGIAVFYFLWLLNAILDDFQKAFFAYLGILMVLLFPLFLYRTGVRAEQTKEAESSVEEGEAGFAGLLRTLAVVVYFALILAFLADALGAGVLSWLSGDSGRMLLQSLFDSSLAIALGVVSWEVFRSFIERHMPEQKQDLESLMEGDGGGGEGATRSATLLPLLRNFVLVLIIAVVVIIVLSSLGVNTAPLLAGAGVVGIAIGFGAQKLVQDVVSGIFFLIDDAFRVGEYIETGELVGTVESISARSVRLRHHLGPVQTIPFGEIKAVKNHSRDFVIMKLKFRVPFDTDIEKVRKTIKKVGQEMLKDEELGPDFLAPVKSQGVLSVEDDALLMRMKFTAKPGKQWVIRREAYRRVKEALEAQSIRFANKQVTVHIPEGGNLDENRRAEIAGSAAGAIDQPLKNRD